MANIQKRGNSYKIRVYVGTDENGKKLIKSTTFVPPHDVTEKKAEKLVLAINSSLKPEDTVVFGEEKIFEKNL